MNFEQQRKRAKELLRAFRQGERAAAERIARVHPRARMSSIDRVLALPLQLADAQLVIAREQGYASWPRLKRAVDTRGEVAAPPPLHEAVRARDLGAVETILAAGPPPWQTREAIELAIERDDRAIVRALCAHAGWVDTAGRAFGRWGGGLHAALLLGRDVAMIDELLAGGASIAARDRDGRTPLQIAVRTAHDDAAAALRRAGASDGELEAIDRALGACIANGERVAAVPTRRSDHQHLAWAIRRGHAAAVPALLALGLDPNVADDDGALPLHLARTPPLVDMLVAAGARVDAVDFAGETAYALAVRRGDEAVAARLAAAGASRAAPPDLDELFEDAVDAITLGKLDALRALLDREPRLVTARSRREHRATLLHYVGANGLEHQTSHASSPAIARLLIARGADPEAAAMTYGGGPTQTALYLAATSSIPEEAGTMVPLIEALVAGGARVHDDDREQLHISQPSALPALVAAGATVDLWVAAALGRVDDVRRFVRADHTLAPGAKVGSEATTPDATIIDRAFLEACAAGHLAIVEILVLAGARLDSRDVVAMTGLHRATWHDRLDVARYLISRGAPLHAKTVYGGTPLGQLRWALANDKRVRPNAPALIEALVTAETARGATSR